MKKRVALIAFNGDPMCFVHVLLNALDMDIKGYEVKIVIEGSATKTVNQLLENGNPFSKLYLEVRDKGLIDGVCQACAHKMDALEGIREQGLPLLNDMKGHPGLAKYMEQGFELITF